MRSSDTTAARQDLTTNSEEFDHAAMKSKKSLENGFTQSARPQTDCVQISDIASRCLTICAPSRFCPIVSRSFQSTPPGRNRRFLRPHPALHFVFDAPQHLRQLRNCVGDKMRAAAVQLGCRRFDAQRLIFRRELL